MEKTVLRLTAEQMALLDQTPPDGASKPRLPTISLNPQQRLMLAREAGFAPEELEVWPVADAKSTCTCEVLNMGVRFRWDRIEVPHYLLGGGIDDRRNRTAIAFVDDPVGRAIAAEELSFALRAVSLGISLCVMMLLLLGMRRSEYRGSAGGNPMDAHGRPQ